MRGAVRFLAVCFALALTGGGAVPDLSVGAFPTQSLGDQGVDVEAFQLLLSAHGFPVPPSGLFGSATESAALAFQGSRGLRTNGLADDPTWAALVVSLSEGASGPAVLALDRQLAVKHGLDAGLPGIYDAPTRASVATFQSHMGIPATGDVDVATWRALVGHFVYPRFDDPEMCPYWDRHDAWGTAALVSHLERGSEAFFAATGIPVAVGDISLEHGGFLENHTSHRVGLDVDLRLIRLDRSHCEERCVAGVCRDECTVENATCYDREATRKLIGHLVDAAFGHVLRVYLDDPHLVGYRGVVKAIGGHADHLHVRYCEAFHTNATYDDCGGTSPGPV